MINYLLKKRERERNKDLMINDYPFFLLQLKILLLARINMLKYSLDMSLVSYEYLECFFVELTLIAIENDLLKKIRHEVDDFASKSFKMITLFK